MFTMGGRHLVNVFDSDSNINEKDSQDQDLFEDANQDNDQISVSSDGSVSLALSNSDVNDSDNSIGNKEYEVDGNNRRSISRLFSDSFYSLSDSIGGFAGKLIPENGKVKDLEMAFKEEHDGRIKAEERNKELEDVLNSTQEQLQIVSAEKSYIYAGKMELEQKFHELDAEKTEAEQISAEEINDLKAEGQKVAKELISTLQQLQIVSDEKDAADLLVFQRDEENCTINAENMKLKQELQDAGKAWTDLENAKKKDEQEIKELRGELKCMQLKWEGSERIIALQGKTIQQFEQEKEDFQRKLEAEAIDKEDAILRAEVAEIQYKELEVKLQRLIEEAVKCGREIDEIKATNK